MFSTGERNHDPSISNIHVPNRSWQITSRSDTSTRDPSTISQEIKNDCRWSDLDHALAARSDKLASQLEFALFRGNMGLQALERKQRNLENLLKETKATRISWR